MMQIRQGELAQTKKPVGMPRPFHFNIVGEMEGSFQLLPHHFIHNCAIVDAQNRDALALVLIE